MTAGHTTGEEVEIAVAHEASPVPGIFLPDSKHLDIFGEGEYQKVAMTFRARRLTRVPSLLLQLNELDAKKVLIDVKDSRYNFGHREVLLHEHVIEIECLLDVLAIIVSVVPDVEVFIERDAALFVFGLFHGEQRSEFLVSDGFEFRFEVSKELVLWELSGCTRISEACIRREHPLHFWPS